MPLGKTLSEKKMPDHPTAAVAVSMSPKPECYG